MMSRLLCGALIFAPVTAEAGSLGLWRRGVESYSTTGQLPATPVWDALKLRHDLDPVRFDAHHPRLEGLFTPPDCPGEVPKTPFWDRLEQRYELNPNRFAKYHPFLGLILARNAAAEANCPVGQNVVPLPPIPPECSKQHRVPCTPPPPTAIPSPDGITLGIIGIAILSLVSKFRRFGG